MRLHRVRVPDLAELPPKCLAEQVQVPDPVARPLRCRVAEPGPDPAELVLLCQALARARDPVAPARARVESALGPDSPGVGRLTSGA